MPRGIRRSPAAEPVAERIEPTLSPRAIETRRERRRRDEGDIDGFSRMKLAIPHDVQARLSREGKVARWILDKDNRLAGMHANDWDATPGVAAVPESGDSENKLVLHEKYRDWWEDDQRKKTVRLDEMDKAIMRGEISGDGKATSDLHVAGTNRISRG